MSLVVESGKKIKQVQDWDFVFTNGMVYPITLDLEAGDKLFKSDSVITITLAARPSKLDPMVILPEETVVIFLDKLTFYKTLQREEVENKELSEELRQTILSRLDVGTKTH